MPTKNSQYRRPLIYSILLHTSIIILALVNIHFMPKAPQWASPNRADQDVIQAVTVNSAEVQKQVQAIKAQQQAKQQALQQQAADLRKQQAAAAAAKANLAKLQQQQKQAQQKLADLQKQQAAAQQQLQKQQTAAAQAAKAAPTPQTTSTSTPTPAQTTPATPTAPNLKQQQLEQAFQQQVNAEQAQIAAARNQQILSEVEKYKALIINAVGQQWIVPANANRKLACTLTVSVAPGGMVLNVKVAKTSGNPALDQSAVTAVYKASPLPVPSDPEIFNQFRTLNLVVQPEQITAASS